MSISRDEVRRIAALARLRFSDDEEARLASDLSRILDLARQLETLDTSAVPPMAHVLELEYAGRPDTLAPRIGRPEALQNAPAGDGVFFRVPKVID
jgi:aspartyl-tRNA(Asn)/glutamyl-tRNA(Gln) amidotransferase subunit C